MAQNCRWHKDDQPVHPSIGCEYCGTMLTTKQCENCRRYFLDWEDNSFDDVIAGPYVSESGDLMCMSCGPAYEREHQRDEDEYADYYDPAEIY